MLLKAIRDEDYSSYKEVSMLVAFPYCDFKCCIDAKRSISMCQNSPAAKLPSFYVPASDIYEQYSRNVITHSIVCAGLEPLKSFYDLCDLLYTFRYENGCSDMFVIYTGYDKNENTEIKGKINILKENFSNIIMKFGRYVPNQLPHYDEILGVILASPNQYAERIS